ncbi:MAG TPA: tetratricopeptide repeat protein, partial [Myxococcota bacterium]|nr:tetratricopeptide repeat protein [Myxococcota bacterium]
MRADRRTGGGLRSLGPWCAACVLAAVAGCASAPEPKPEPAPPPADQADKPSEPDKPPEPPPPPGEEAAAGTKLDEATPPPDELSLSEDTSRLLAAAAQAADGDPAAALRLVEQAAEGNPKCYPCQYNRGVLLERQGRWDDAALAYRKALQIHAAHLASVINLSNLQLRLRRPAEAQATITAAVKAAPKDPGLRNQLAAVLLGLGKNEEAA